MVHGVTQPVCKHFRPHSVLPKCWIAWRHMVHGVTQPVCKHFQPHSVLPKCPQAESNSGFCIPSSDPMRVMPGSLGKHTGDQTTNQTIRLTQSCCTASMVHHAAYYASGTARIAAVFPQQGAYRRYTVVAATLLLSKDTSTHHSVAGANPKQPLFAGPAHTPPRLGPYAATKRTHC
jgi:hypothetical protein